MDQKVSAHIFVSGRVQGVLFRYSTRNRAKTLGVTGWVRNLSDGRVEAVFEGERDNVEMMIDWARKGSFLAKVKNVDVNWQQYKGKFNDFKKR